MDHVVKQFKDSCDGFYLFANLDAVDFYDKCGFSKEIEYHMRKSCDTFGCSAESERGIS